MAQKKTAGSNGLIKKIIALLTAGTMFVSGGIFAKYEINNYKAQTSTSVSDNNDVNNGNDEETTNEVFNPEGILYKPYSIKSDKELQEILDEVEKLTGQKIDIRFIKILYSEFLDKNNALTKDSFKEMPGDEFFEWFRAQQNTLYSSLDYGVGTYEKLKRDIINGKDEKTIKDLKDKLPSQITIPYSIMPKEVKGYNTIQLELSKLIYKEKNDIKNENINECEKNSKEFLRIMDQILSNNTLSDGERYHALQGIDPWLPVFELSIDKNNKKDYEELKKLILNFQGEILNEIYSSKLTDFGIILPPKTGEPCTVKREGEKYNKDDAAKANTNGTGTTKKVAGGTKKSNGKHSTYKEQVKTATTTKETTTYVVDVPDDNKNQTTSKKSGGKPTGTTSVVTETTSHLYDYDVQPGTEYSYSDDSVNDKSKTLTP